MPHETLGVNYIKHSNSKKINVPDIPAPVNTIIFSAFRIKFSASVSDFLFSGTLPVLSPKPNRPNKLDRGSSSLSELELTDDELRDDMFNGLNLESEESLKKRKCSSTDVTTMA